ncbi:MAG TPA: TonB-dependent receptor, partial [Steroidobacteraceae bacterium]|nr:TonB-dependent receptor [Steroidobacteraceae bacterium]
MSTSNSIRRAVRHALLAGATATAVTALPATAQEQSISEVVVTGSRILNRDTVADTPIMTVDQTEVLQSGNITVDHYLNTLPQVTPTVSSQSNNPSLNGRAHIDLRGLGIVRNLVLIDGRRGMGSGFGTGGGTAVDINTIPAALIERVEVITGGAGATYGADAVAGVTNFIMKKSFDGVAFSSTYRLTEQEDGQEWSADATFGGDFADGKGSAVFNASYFKRDDMYKDAREFAAQASTTTGTFPGGSWSPGTNTPSQASVDALFGANACNANGGQAGFGFNPDGSLFCTGVQNNATRDVVGFTGPDSWIATQFYPDLFSYNFEPDNILVLPMERWSLYTHIDMEMTSFFKPYVTAQYTNYNALQELAPTPAGGATGFQIPVTNPFVPAALQSLLATRANPAGTIAYSKRFNDLGGRTGYNTHDVWQLTLGTRGDITDSWHYDIYASYGRSVLNELQGGNVRLDRTQQLLNAADGGASLCEGGLNLFGNAPISQECSDFITLDAKNLTVAEQNIVEGVISGEVFDLPAGPVQVALGAGYRDIFVDFQPDSGLQPGVVAGFNQQLPATGKLDYTDIFTEISIPILADLPAVKDLGLTLGARTTDNNLTGSAETWKATLDWTVVDWFRFRGGVQHAVRSPNIAELFQPQVNNFPNLANSDPCNANSSFRTGASGAQVQALCAQQSAVAGGAAYAQPAGQANGIIGGNPELQPEEADTYTVGFVFQSPWQSPALERLSVSVDYWSIEVDELIAQVPAVTIVQRCYNLDNANPTFSLDNAWCNQFNRDPNNGGVIELEQFQRNQGVFHTSGVDLTVNYGIGLGSFGDLGFRLQGTWVEKFDQQTSPDDPTFDFVGTIGATTASASPELKYTFTTSYSYENLAVQVVSRFIDSMTHNNLLTNPQAIPADNTGV